MSGPSASACAPSPLSQRIVFELPRCPFRRDDLLVLNTPPPLDPPPPPHERYRSDPIRSRGYGVAGEILPTLPPKCRNIVLRGNHGGKEATEAMGHWVPPGTHAFFQSRPGFPPSVRLSDVFFRPPPSPSGFWVSSSRKPVLEQVGVARPPEA